MRNNGLNTIATKKQWGEDVFSHLSWFQLDKVRKAKVLVAGAGALGNEVLKNLALFGIGNIIIVDFDTIEYSNLTRSILFRAEDADKGLYKADISAKRIKKINPSIQVKAICGNLSTDVGLSVYRNVDVVIGCVDSLASRILLNRLCFRANKVWIDGGISESEGRVNGFARENNCFECSLTEDEIKEIRERISCTGIAHLHESYQRVVTTPVIASVIGAVQVQEALKVIHQEDIREGLFTTLIGKMFHYEVMCPTIEIFEDSSYKYDCPSHEYWNQIISINTLSADSIISDALQQIKENLCVEDVEINMRNDKFVDKIMSRSLDKQFVPMLPESKIPEYINMFDELKELASSEGGLYQNSYENIDREFPYLHLTLREVGFPYWDVIQVTTEKGHKYIELSADKIYYENILC